ncbi:YSIRK family gram-positive signal peptide [Pleurostoma richardsiae]|uniref:YSIRK family gram-positive signal peptide n=1 Tax=Pleurostoma richardsiae TaxID=41990 RepID=A0AA38VV28_9PEZI|nr:YSIRK family gram-positive signal peptide [Pleurostoma richardsiae]
MAPLSSEPRHILVVLNPARRKALYQLVVEITARMRSELDLHGRAADQPSSTGPQTAARPPASPQLVSLRAAAMADLDRWRRDFHTRLKELVTASDDARILEQRRVRQERIARERTDTSEGDLLGLADDTASSSGSTESDVAALQRVYPPVATRLTTVPVEDRREVLSAVLLLLLSAGKYSAYSRAFAMYLTSSLELPPSVLDAEEMEIAKSLLEASSRAVEGGSGESQAAMTAQAEAEKRKQQNQSSRFWKVGLASVAGAAVIGITGGLAAPVVAGAIGGLMGTVGLGGVASFLGIFWMNGALVGTLFGAFGARMTGEMMDKYAREVEDFRFLPLHDEGPSEADKPTHRLRVTIGVNGWLTSKDEVTKPWRALGADTEVFALRYEMDSLLALGRSLEGLVSSHAWSLVKVEILKRTVLATLWSALWPAYLLSAAASVDNPFSLARNRSEKAGRILADALVNRAQGERPVTLVGYSLGARAVCACLRELAERRAFGLVDTVVLVGAPVPSSREHWLAMRSVVAGRMFNVYSENDYILAFLYRATSVQLGVAGLQAIRGVGGVENLNLSPEVEGHLRYPELIPKILTRCGFPGVKGGEGPIERDTGDGAVTILEAEHADKMGRPVDSEELPAEALVSVPVPIMVTPHLAEPETDSGRGAASDGPSQQYPPEPKSLGSFSHPSRGSSRTGIVSGGASDTQRGKNIVYSDPPPPYSHGDTSTRSSVAAERIPQVQQEERTAGDAVDEYEEEEWIGIQMVDEDHENDSDMVSYMEPLRIKDD